MAVFAISRLPRCTQFANAISNIKYTRSFASRHTRCFRPSAASNLPSIAVKHPSYKLLLTHTSRQTVSYISAAMTVPAEGSIPAQLDRDAFKQPVKLHALRIPKQQCNALLGQLKGLLFTRPKMRAIVEDSTSEEHRLLLLSEDLAGLTPEDVLKTPLQQGSGTIGDLLQSQDLQLVDKEVTIEYFHLSTNQILKRLLPEGVEIPSAFEAVGHIAHLNLKDEVLPWKHLIGQVLLDKNPALKTVVNKVGNIENEYRVFAMEVLAGSTNLEAEVKQLGARFKLDFSKVYWNSRLEAEHKRLVSLFQPADVVVDVMAGIGPFAVPAAKQGCTVYANDLNPDSYKWLRENIRVNKVQAKVHPYNMDGRAFIRAISGSSYTPAEQNGTTDTSAAQPAATSAPSQAATQAVATTPNPDPSNPQSTSQNPNLPDTVSPSVCPSPLVYQHAIMNLPASAIEFVDAFQGAFDQRLWEGRPLPTAHCYAFQRTGETQQDLIARLEGYLGGPLEGPPAFHLVRSVAPNKDMVCISFQVPSAVAFAAESPCANAQDCKRQKVQ